MSTTTSTTKRRKISKDVVEAPKLKSKSRVAKQQPEPEPSPSPAASEDEDESAAEDIVEAQQDEAVAPQKTFKDLV